MIEVEVVQAVHAVTAARRRAELGEQAIDVAAATVQAEIANFKAGQQNSVLVITQGPHTDQTLDGPGLQQYIQSALDQNRPVDVNVIDIGNDPDQSTWQAVAQMSGGTFQAVPSADSPDLIAAITAMLN